MAKKVSPYELIWVANPYEVDMYYFKNGGDISVRLGGENDDEVGQIEKVILTSGKLFDKLLPILEQRR